MNKWEFIFHGAEIFILGVPIWWGFLKFYFVHKEYPPHLHTEKGQSKQLSTDGLVYPLGTARNGGTR